MKGWRLTGLAATLAIVISIPLYLFRVGMVEPQNSVRETRKAEFAGGESCVSCHKAEAEKWRNSHHDRAMDVATPETVLGNFDNAVFRQDSDVFRFFRRGDEFFVNARDADGQAKDFRITHTFGYKPLQQYLIPFKNRRLQCLPVAWDTDKNRWYHLNPDERATPSNWMHWTRQSHNWNSMCSECHSTHLQKRFDPESDSYRTTWKDIDVNCEACHGPGSLHNEWAELPELARPVIENFGLVVRTRDLDPEQQIAVCARCHSRRMQLKPFDHREPEMLDTLIPDLLTEGLYHPDGQIRDEVYVYGSFVQSRMYHNGVRCSDCHDVHSGGRLLTDNALCLQCHRAEAYDSKTHHFHKSRGEDGKPVVDSKGRVVSTVGEGALCVKCHMPEQTYMGIDRRADHSLRVPRPDLSLELGTPNACNQCHLTETAEWSNDHVSRWYGISRKPHYGSLLAAGRRGDPAAETNLIRLAGDGLYPVIVRATALQLLGGYSSGESQQAFDLALQDEQALIRYAAVRYTNRRDPERRKNQLLPMLQDPVRAVRMECAMSLAAIPGLKMAGAEQTAFKKALGEYEAAMTYNADFPFSGLNLGNLYFYLGRQEQAEAQYRRAISIAPDFNPARLNLAVLLSGRGKNSEAETQLQRVIESEPKNWEAHYKLGLLLVEVKNLIQAANHLEKAADGFGDRARIYYNLGLLRQRLGDEARAGAALNKALALEPDNPKILYGAAYFYYQTGQLPRASQLARRLTKVQPENPVGRQLLELIRRQQKTP